MNYFNLILIATISIFASCSKNSKNQETITYNIDYIYPELPLSPGDGIVQVLPSQAVCRNSKGVIVDNSHCVGIENVDLSTSPTRPQASPPGKIAINIPGSEGEVEVDLKEGETYSDLSDSDKVSQIKDQITCSSGLLFTYKATCEAQSFALLYDLETTNPLLVCDGSITVPAEASCVDNITGNKTTTTDCDHLTRNEIHFLSPAGDITETLLNGDEVRITCLEGQEKVNGAVAVISCGEDRHQNISLACEDDSFVASDFTYPPNSLNPGDGSQVYFANGFNVCTNETKSTPADLSKCALPLPLPEMTVLSPSGEARVMNSLGDDVLVSFSEGEVLSDNSLILEYYSCGEGRFLNEVDACINEEIISIVAGQQATAFLTNKKVVYSTGNVNYGGQIPPGKASLLVNVKKVYSDNSFGRAFAALKEDGSVVAWGDTSRGGETPTPITNIKEVHPVGSYGFVAVTNDDNLVAWGDSLITSIPSGGNSNIEKVVTNISSVLVLRKDGTVRAWGRPVDGGGLIPAVSSLNDIEDIFKARTSFLVRRSSGQSYVLGTHEVYPDDFNYGCKVNNGDILNSVQSSTYLFAGIKTNGAICAYGGSYGFPLMATQALISADSIYVANNSLTSLFGNVATLIGIDTSTYTDKVETINDILSVHEANGTFLGVTTSGGLKIWSIGPVEYQIISSEESEDINLITDVSSVTSDGYNFKVIKNDGSHFFISVQYFGITKQPRLTGVKGVVSTIRDLLIKREGHKDILYANYVKTNLPTYLYDTEVE